jgi:hypothetical protein
MKIIAKFEQVKPVKSIPLPVTGRAMQKVIALLAITEVDYNDFLFDCAFAFANHFYGVKSAVTQVIKTRAYWQWYRNQFEQRDELFLHLYGQSCESKKALRELWKDEHSAHRMDAYPGKEVVYEAMQGVYDMGVNESKSGAL